MSSSARLVDWWLAERVGAAVAGAAAGRESVPEGELTRAAEHAERLVGEYTSLEPREAIPRAETVDRGEWVAANLTSFRRMGDELEERLVHSLPSRDPIRGVVRRLTGGAVGGQLGLALGYMGRKVLGQYDVALIGPRRPPRLLFIGPNLADAHSRLGEPRALFLSWIAGHEVTHAYQFAAVPWLRDHLGGMVEELLGTASASTAPSELRGALGRLLPPNPGRIVEQIREGGVVRLLTGPEQDRLLGRLQATMTVVEGYSEHVMDAIGAELDPGYTRLRAATDARRKRRGTLDAVLSTLLGLGMKLRQYEIGKRFADTVVQRAGIGGLNAVWRSPDHLPTREEVERPQRWLERVAPGQRVL